VYQCDDVLVVVLGVNAAIIQIQVPKTLTLVSVQKSVMSTVIVWSRGREYTTEPIDL
jgi:hypothetical protein